MTTSNCVYLSGIFTVLVKDNMQNPVCCNHNTPVCSFIKFKPSQLMQTYFFFTQFKQKHSFTSNDCMSRTCNQRLHLESGWIERDQCYTGCDWPLTSISSRVWSEDASVGPLETMTELASNPFSVFNRHKYPALIEGITPPAWCQ